MDNRKQNHVPQLETANQSVSTLHPLVTLLLSKPYRWRLFIDGRNQDDNDPYYFDKKSNGKNTNSGEIGYFDSMNLAFDFMIETLDQPLTLSLIEKFHDLTLDKVIFTSGMTADERKGYRNHRVVFKLSQSATLDGIEDYLSTYNHLAAILDMESKIILTDMTPKEIQDLILKHENRYYRVDAFKYPDVESLKSGIKLKLKTLIDDYEQDQKLAKDDKDKLLAIVRFAHAADLLHPFPDANIRTFVFIIVTKLLLQNGFFPAIFFDPNVFDYSSEAELYWILKTGQMQWLIIAIKECDDQLLSSLLTCKEYLPEQYDHLEAILTHLLKEAILHRHLSGLELILKYMQQRFNPEQMVNIVTPLLSTIFEKPSSVLIDQVRLFIDYGADMNTIMLNGYTPLTWAIYHQDIEIVTTLIACKVDICMCDKSGKNPLQYATDANDDDILHIVSNAIQPYGANAHTQFFALPTNTSTVQEQETQQFKKRKH